MLDGALALALPTRHGQEMRVTAGSSRDERLHWRSLDQEGRTWFEGVFSPPDLRCEYHTDEATARRLIELFAGVRRQRPAFWQNFRGATVETRLSFPREWGLGSSSTLVAALARWTDTDPFGLLGDSFGGSGYDLACAFAHGPILYQRRNGRPHFVDFPYRPPFAANLYFVYLGHKQDSRAGIARYRAKVKDGAGLAEKAAALTVQFLTAATLPDLEHTIRAHEQLIGEALELPRAKELYFPDYWGEVKSLGAWGGDFALVTSNRGEPDTRAYFVDRGLPTVLPYEELALF